MAPQLVRDERDGLDERAERRMWRTETAKDLQRAVEWEREACGRRWSALMAKTILRAIKWEREACACIVDEASEGAAIEDTAALIRARKVKWQAKSTRKR